MATEAAEAPRARDRFYPRLFGVAGLAVLVWLLVGIFRPFLQPIVWSALLALLIHPVEEKWTRRRPRQAGLGAGLLTAATAVGVVVPSVALAVAFTGQVSRLLERVSERARALQLAQASDLLRLPPVAAAADWLRAHFSVTAAELEQRAAGIAGRALEWIAARSGSIVLGAAGLLLNVVLTLFLLFFFLRDGPAMAARLDRAIPIPSARKKALAKQLASVTRAVVLGTMATAVIQGVLVGIAFAVVGFPSPVVFGAAAGALSLLPIGGTAFVWLPGAIVLASRGRWPWAIGLALYGILIVGALTNDVLKPRLIAGRAPIGTLPVFFGVLGGLASFGLIGMVLGPVVIALAIALLGWAEEAQAPARATPVALAAEETTR